MATHPDEHGMVSIPFTELKALHASVQRYQALANAANTKTTAKIMKPPGESSRRSGKRKSGHSRPGYSKKQSAGLTKDEYNEAQVDHFIVMTSATHSSSFIADCTKVDRPFLRCQLFI